MLGGRVLVWSSNTLIRIFNILTFFLLIPIIIGCIALEEAQIGSVWKEITMLYVFFFLFHPISLILLFVDSSRDLGAAACRRSWIPLLCTLLFSLGLISAVRYKIYNESHSTKLFEREGILVKCVEELKK
ncbi:hypothetical protein PanWU01x14_123960 [Parasponia andersonii]|uniref:Transmembrane protein n=1 Tax=Parasponia andersonii TaxID=3476 RepID=A0A2P5CTZ0_PARAD|nr:hypothetical protein PanWU01x14_123960 [Parasponia andersonii]